MTDKNLSAETPVQPATRRRFLGRAAAGAAGAAAMAAPMVSVAQSPVVLKMQGAWGAKDIFNEMARSTSSASTKWPAAACASTTWWPARWSSRSR